MDPSGSNDPALLKLMEVSTPPLYGPLASATGDWFPPPPPIVTWALSVPIAPLLSVTVSVAVKAPEDL